jgi:hypothetical protein
VEQLAAVLRPPAGGGDSIDWEQIRLEHGVVFPADYRSFVEVYGGGSIDDYIAIFTPEVEDSPYGMILGGAALIPGLRHSDGYPYYPDPDGIFHWGGDMEGDDVFWNCVSDDPDEWTILVWKRHPGPYEERWEPFSGGMVEFLLAMIRDGHPSPFAVRDIPSSSSTFTGWREEVI